MQNGENGEERKEMYSIMKKSRLLALLAATVFFISEAVSFIQPVAAMAANPKDGDLGASYESQKYEAYKKDDKEYTATEITKIEVSKGKLPDGLSIKTGENPYKPGKAAWWIEGIPAEAGTFQFTIYDEFNGEYDDGSKWSDKASTDFEITINDSRWESTTYPRGELGKKYDEKYYPGYTPVGGKPESAEEILDYKATGLPKGLEFTGPFKDDKGAYLRLSGVPEEEGKFTIQMWRKIKSSSGTSESGGEQYIQIGEDKDDDDHHDHKPASWELNPNEKRQLVITFTGTPASLAAGYQEQGAAAQALMKTAVPAGWTKAFSFNLLNSQRQPETNLKTGTMTLYIPSEYQKAGRQFALVILDKGGQTYLLSDMDTNPGTITVPLNYEGYAMDLLYKD